MKFWKTEEPRLLKELRLLKWGVLASVAVYVLMAVALALLTRDQFIGGWIILAFFGLYGAMFLPVLLATANFIRFLRTAKYPTDIPDSRLDKGLSITAFISGMVALALFLIETLWDLPVKYPWDELTVSAQMRSFMMVALAVTLSALLLDYVLEMILRGREKKHGATKKVATAKRLRIVAATATLLILLGALLIPYENAVYNDTPKGKGSRYHKATLYEVIDWRRNPGEGTMGRPDGFDPNEEQHTRIYVFPFNCYTFEAKWEMKH
jgi:heme/copper-type cytochrome/quinol oxidase subunit 2